MTRKQAQSQSSLSVYQWDAQCARNRANETRQVWDVPSNSFTYMEMRPTSATSCTSLFLRGDKTLSRSLSGDGVGEGVIGNWPAELSGGSVNDGGGGDEFILPFGIAAGTPTGLRPSLQSPSDQQQGFVYGVDRTTHRKSDNLRVFRPTRLAHVTFSRFISIEVIIVRLTTETSICNDLPHFDLFTFAYEHHQQPCSARQEHYSRQSSEIYCALCLRSIADQSIRPLRASTGITGLEVNPNALADLKKVYGSTLSLLSTLPATSVYRQATEALTKHRLNAVESAGEDVGKLESGLGNMAEVILEEAKSEQLLAGNMLEWKSCVIQHSSIIDAIPDKVLADISDGKTSRSPHHPTNGDTLTRQTQTSCRLRLGMHGLNMCSHERAKRQMRLVWPLGRSR